MEWTRRYQLKLACAREAQNLAYVSIISSTWKIEAKFPGAGIQHDYNINLECTDRSQRFENAARGTATSTIIMYADDILLLGRSRDEIEGMMAIILDTFTAFGLTLAADDKTVTMTWNTPIETREQQSLIKLGTTDLENVNQFKYLGHWMTDDPKKPQYISQQISQAWAKWAEIKHILTDNEVWLWIRVTKRWLFTESEHPRTRNQWKELGRELGMDEQQTRRMLFRKEELNAWLHSRETP